LGSSRAGIATRFLFRIDDAKRAETRARRIAQFVEMLARGETVYPQKNKGVT
jgi:uncharacterized protein YdeI (YjbR/CyaY-like superfamily)